MGETGKDLNSSGKELKTPQILEQMIVTYSVIFE
jgi:hypothetical protein